MEIVVQGTEFCIDFRIVLELSYFPNTTSLAHGAGNVADSLAVALTKL